MCVKVFLLCCICGIPTVYTEFKLRIIHTNDIGGTIDQVTSNYGQCSVEEAAKNNCYGGIARLIAASNAELKKARKERTAAIFLDAGGHTGTGVWDSFYKWQIMAQFIGMLKLDALNIGTKEFDRGPENLKMLMGNIMQPIVGSNIDVTMEPKMRNTDLRKKTIIRRNGTNIGVIGYVSAQTQTLSNPGKVRFRDEIKAIETQAEILKNAGVNIIIALGYAGIDKDIEIANAVPDLDVIVGGSSYTFLYSGTPPDNENNTGPYPQYATHSSEHNVIIVHTPGFTKYLGKIEVVFNDNGIITRTKGNPILLDSNIEVDPIAEETINFWRSSMETEMNKRIAKTQVLLNGTCGFNECNLGNLITDILVDCGRRKLLNKRIAVSIAIYRAGGIRRSIDPKDNWITIGDIYATLPYFVQLSVSMIKGKYILEALEWSVERYGSNEITGCPEFLQVSGLHVLYDLHQPVGSRVVKVTVRCGKCNVPDYFPLDPETSYPVVLDEFTANGGDSFTMLQQHRTLIETLGTSDTDAVIEYLFKKEVVYNGVDERILFVPDASSKFRIKRILLILCSIYHYS